MTHLPIAAPEEIGLSPQRLDRAYALLREWTSGPEAPILGGAILVGRHGKIAPPQFFGRQGPEPDAPAIRSDGMFLLASITKPVTYLAAMILVERGQLNLSEYVTHYIPDFAAHHKEETRVLHLFTHTSGLPDMLENNTELRARNAPLSEFIQGAIRDTVPLFPPGTNLSYQSMGTLVVAELVQRISGMTIHAFIKKEILDPLGLKSTGLGAAGLDRSRIVRVETVAEQRKTSYHWNSEYWQNFGAPWGGMFSSPEDFAVICQMMLGDGEYDGVRLLAPGAVRMITTNRLDDLPDLPEPIRRAQPWGLGWRMNQPGAGSSWGDLLDRQVFGHSGATGTLCWIDRQRDGFCLIFTTTPYGKHPWRIRNLSNALAAAFVGS